MISRSPSTLFDQAPHVAEVLRQINQSKTAVLELRNQLGECQSSSSQSRMILQGEVESLRERKRQDDASKLETKSRTKTLDDSKRTAETVKKDADKKLKAAQNVRDAATQRIGHLDKEILLLKQRVADDEILMRQSQETISEAEKALLAALEQKKEEIKVAEDIVAALNQRARELEERVLEGKQRLEARQRSRAVESLHSNQLIGCQESPPGLWQFSTEDSITGPLVSEVSQNYPSQMSVERMNPNLRSYSRDNQVISRNELNPSATAAYSSGTSEAVLGANGYPVFGDATFSLVSKPYQQTTTSFSPFSDADHEMPDIPGVVSPTTQSLVPSALMASLDGVEGLPRSFQSESDVYMAKDWRATLASRAIRTLDIQVSANVPLTSSPVSIQAPRDFDDDFCEVRVMNDYGQDREARHQRSPGASMHLQRAARSNSDPGASSVELDQATPSIVVGPVGTKRWFPTISKDKPKKGLNPEAKVFSLSRKPTPAIQTMYDALNPNGVGSTAVPPSTSATNNTSLLRAFAPSPAEREALQRALGGSSSNASFELLPSLSDVGSIPSSPVHAHASTAIAVPHVPQHSVKEMAKVLPSWLQSLPKIRKTNFSPWEDEEPVGSIMGVGDGVQSGRAAGRY